MCADLSDGFSLFQMHSQAVEFYRDGRSEDAAQLAAAELEDLATSEYCPEFRDEFEATFTLRGVDRVVVARSLPATQVRTLVAALVLLLCLAVVPSATAAPTCRVLELPSMPSETAAIFLHGGSWQRGDPYSDPWYRPVRDELVEGGMAAGTVQYRLIPSAPWPAPLEDARCAVDYLRELGYEHVVAWGSSAGGHLAAILAIERRVDRAVALYPPVDVSRWPEVFGDADGSPLAFVDGPSAPLLIVQGTADELAPLDGAERLRDATRAELLTIPRGDHGLLGEPILGPIVRFLEGS